MSRFFSSRPFRLWLLILAFLGLCLEVGHLTGRFEPRFLDGLFPQARWWWDQPVRPHVFAAVVLLTLVVMMGRRLLPAARLPGWRRGRGRPAGPA